MALYGAWAITATVNLEMAREATDTATYRPKGCRVSWSTPSCRQLVCAQASSFPRHQSCVYAVAFCTLANAQNFRRCHRDDFKHLHPRYSSTVPTMTHVFVHYAAVPPPIIFIYFVACARSIPSLRHMRRPRHTQACTQARTHTHSHSRTPLAYCVHTL